MKIDVLLIPSARDTRTCARPRSPPRRPASTACGPGITCAIPTRRAEAGVPEAWTVLTALAEATRRITLGPLVLNTGLRHPGCSPTWRPRSSRSRAAASCSASARAPPGRWPTRASRRRSTWRSRRDRVRAERVAETAQVLRRPVSTEASSFAGTQFRLDRPSGFLRPDPPPPIIVAGFGPRMAASRGATTASTPRPCTRTSPSWPAWPARPTPRRAAIPRGSA